jgi:hypothetical protein
MASPVKAFIDPSGIYVTQAIYTLIPAKTYVPYNKTIIAIPQIPQMVPRFSIVPVVTPRQAIYNLLPSQSDLSTAKIMTLNTFSSIYQERGASAARPTEGQLYPTGF